MPHGCGISMRMTSTTLSWITTASTVLGADGEQIGDVDGFIVDARRQTRQLHRDRFGRVVHVPPPPASDRACRCSRRTGNRFTSTDVTRRAAPAARVRRAIASASLPTMSCAPSNAIRWSRAVLMSRSKRCRSRPGATMPAPLPQPEWWSDATTRPSGCSWLATIATPSGLPHRGRATGALTTATRRSDRARRDAGSSPTPNARPAGRHARNRDRRRADRDWRDREVEDERVGIADAVVGGRTRSCHRYPSICLAMVCSCRFDVPS